MKHIYYKCHSCSGHRFLSEDWTRGSRFQISSSSFPCIWLQDTPRSYRKLQGFQYNINKHSQLSSMLCTHFACSNYFKFKEILHRPKCSIGGVCHKFPRSIWSLLGASMNVGQKGFIESLSAFWHCRRHEFWWGSCKHKEHERGTRAANCGHFWTLHKSCRMSESLWTKSQPEKQLEPLQTGMKHWTQSHHQNDLPFPLQSFCCIFPCSLATSTKLFHCAPSGRVSPQHGLVPTSGWSMIWRCQEHFPGQIWKLRATKVNAHIGAILVTPLALQSWIERKDVHWRNISCVIWSYQKFWNQNAHTHTQSEHIMFAK